MKINDVLNNLPNFDNDDDSGARQSKPKATITMPFTTLLKLIAGIIGITIVFFSGWVASSRLNQQEAPAMLESSVIVPEIEEKQVITSEMVELSIREVVKLATYEYTFKEVLYFSDATHVNFFGNDFELGLTKYSYFASINGKVIVSTDIENLSCDIETNGDGDVVAVSITMPHAQAEVALWPNSLEVFEPRDGLLNPVQVDDVTTLLAQTQDKKELEIKNGELIARADKRAEEIISALIHQQYGENVEVTFQYIDE